MSNQNKTDLVRDFLQKIVDHLPIALFCKDARHNFQYVFYNETASRMWGLSPVEVVGKDDFLLYPSEIATQFRQKDIQTMTTGKIVYIPQEVVPNGTGTMLARTWKIPIYGEDGGPQWLLGISQDVAEQRLIESLHPETGPLRVGLGTIASPQLATQLAEEALGALDRGETELARGFLESIKKLGQKSD